MDVGLIYTAIKEALSISKKFDSIELREKLLDLQQQLNTFVSENQFLTKEISILTEKLNFQSTLKFTKPFYYSDGDDVPYCPKCWEDERKAMHLEGPLQSKLYRCKKCHCAWNI